MIMKKIVIAVLVLSLVFPAFAMAQEATSTDAIVQPQAVATTTMSREEARSLLISLIRQLIDILTLQLQQMQAQALATSTTVASSTPNQVVSNTNISGTGLGLGAGSEDTTLAPKPEMITEIICEKVRYKNDLTWQTVENKVATWEETETPILKMYDCIQVTHVK